MAKKAHGIGLLSGGLDSALAAKVVQDAGAEVTCLHFFTGFCVTGHNSRIGRKDRPIANHALQVAADIGIAVEMVDISEDYLPMVMAPKHGYGANMNPCVDCRIFMLDRARQYMEEVGADFVFTGEVIGQRPMSQMKNTLAHTAKETGLKGQLLRPLSAKLLEPTEVELAGLVDREKLYGFHGRNRKPQLELAEKFGLTDFMQPAGGCCFLTDENYSRKLQDLLDSRAGEPLSMDDVYLLGVGRHFRLGPALRVIVGRDETENNFLNYYTKDRWSAIASDHKGPIALVMGDPAEDDFATVASLVGRYCDGKREPIVMVQFDNNGTTRTIDVEPADNERVEELRI
jgi:tRNA U34 2-thiouridine synthase MnmA/TrmU